MSKFFIANRYGQTPNELLNRNDISLRAKGLYAYLQSKPDKWSFSVARICKQAKDGREAITTAIKELEWLGYLERKPIRNNRGLWDGYKYILSENRLPKTRSTVSPLTIKPYTFSNKDISNKDIVIKNTDTSKADALPVNDFIELFKGINPLYAHLFKNKTERKSAEALLRIYPLEDWKHFFEVAPKIINLPYCPVFNSPRQLEQKFSNIMTFVKQTEEKQKNVFKII